MERLDAAGCSRERMLTSCLGTQAEMESHKSEEWRPVRREPAGMLARINHANVRWMSRLAQR
jgi:hypothetical protein